MALEKTPLEVQVTLTTGKVLDFQTVLGDKISLTTTNTVVKQKGEPEEPVVYHTLVIVPKEQ